MVINWGSVLTALITVLGAVCGSVGLWNYLDHRQQRKADKEMQDNEILKEIKNLRDEITELRNTVDENEAKASRIRILKFADEVYMEMNHSKDSFDQCLSDATFYEKFCKDHPDFKNNQTGETIEYIKEVYHERMQKKDFARYGAYRGGTV